MSRYKPYPAYKDSGIEWISKVPDHWDVASFKWHIERNDGGVWGNDPSGSRDTVVLRSTEQTVDGKWIIDQPARRQLSPREKQTALLEEGDLVVTKSSGSSLHIGKTTIVTSEVAKLECCYSNFMQRIRTRYSFLPTLAWYVMNNGIAREQLNLLSNSTTGLANINGGIIGQLLLAIPPANEQKALVNGLDRETARIDTLIAKKTRFIELLKEKRQAVITKAVTKGLDDSVEMKDSGLEWLGYVPTHWPVMACKYGCSLIKDGTHLPPARVGDGVPLLSVRNVQDGRFSFRADDSMISEADYKELCRSFQPMANDVLLAIVGATIGKTAVIPESMGRFHIQRSLAVFRFKESLNYLFMHFLFQSCGFQQLLWEGIGFSAQPGVYLGALSNFRIPVPPMCEQLKIVEYLVKKCERTDALIQKTEHSIELLKEKRSALITAAVTGKIDVREAA